MPGDNGNGVVVGADTKALGRDIEFLYEIGTLRFIDRSWKHLLSADVQNLSEHHLRTLWIALVLAKHEGLRDTEKIMKLAIVHDLSESRTGDVDFVQREYVKRNEKLGISEVFRGTVFGGEYVSLWNEYSEQRTPEARVVKDADNLDVDFEIAELLSKGLKVPERWLEVRRFAAKSKLNTKSAKALWKALQKSNPHDWHVNARNRFNTGDWKHKKA